MPTTKIAVVCSGGGMKCAYSAGALDALYHHYHFTQPHTLIGASGSAGSCAYFAAGQANIGRIIWCYHLTGGKMISFKTWPVFNVEYLVHTVFTKYIPLDVTAVQKSSINFLIPVSNIKTGVTEYVSNKTQGINFLQLLIAAKTIPFVVGKPQCIHTSCTDTYIDGDIAQQLSQHVQKARTIGCDKIIVIDNQTNHSVLLRLFYRLQSLFSSRGTRKATKRGIKDCRESVQSDEHTIVLRPTVPLRMHGLSDQKEKVEHAYDRGYRDAYNSAELRKLFTS